MTNSKKFLIAGWSLYLVDILIIFLFSLEGRFWTWLPLSAMAVLGLVVFFLGTILLLVGFKKNITRIILIAGLVFIAGTLLDNLQTGHPKCYDCSTKAYIASLRTQAELFYGKNGESYGVLSQSCSDKNSIFGDWVMDIKSIEESSQHKASCYSNPQAWAVSVELRSGTGYFCADSTGFSGNVAGNITGPSCESVKIQTNQQ